MTAETEFRVEIDTNIYTPNGVYVDEETWKWVAVQNGTGAVLGMYPSVENAFKHMAPNGLIPHCRLMRSEKYNAESNVFAGMKLLHEE